MKKILFLFLLISSFCYGQKVEPNLINNGETWGAARAKFNANSVRFNDSIYELYLKTNELKESVNTIAALVGSGGGGLPVSNNFTGYDSTYNMTVAMKFAIPENVANGDYIGYWAPTYTWRSGNAIEYSIEVNHQNAFAINSFGLISISDPTKINGKIVRQDTLIKLVIRSNDVVLGFELDTAYIWVKENSFCKFVDYSASAGTGSKASPYNDLGTATISSGYGYFIKRGVTASNKYYYFNGVPGTAAHPTIFGAYGAGTLPVFDGSGLTDVDGVVTLRNTPAVWSHVYFYNWDVRSYPSHGFRVYTNITYCGFYNMSFSDNIRVTVTLGLADIYFYGNLSDSLYSNRKFLEVWNCKSVNTTGPIVKSDATGLTMINIKSETDDPDANNAYNIRANTHYCTLKHFWLIGGQRSLQIRYTHAKIIDGIIEGAAVAGWFSQSDATNNTSGHYAVLDNVMFRNCLDGIHVYNSGTNYWTIKNCYFHKNINNGIYFYNGGTGHVIEKSSFIGNGTYGITFNNSSLGVTNPTLSYNVFSGNLSGALLGTDASCGTGIKLYNNTIDGSVVLTGTSGTIARNNFYKSTMTGVATSSNNINIDGINTADYFVNYAGDDFRIKNSATSAIDLGYSVGITHDMINTQVPFNNATDIGSFEYGPVTNNSEDINLVTLRSDITSEISDSVSNRADILQDQIDNLSISGSSTPVDFDYMIRKSGSNTTGYKVSTNAIISTSTDFKVVMDAIYSDMADSAVVVIKSGVYVPSAAMAYSGKSITIRGVGNVQIKSAISGAYCLSFTGAVLSTTDISTDVKATNDTVKVAAVGTVRINDLVILYRDSVFNPLYDAAWKTGEIHEVRSITSNTMVLNDHTLYRYPVSDNSAAVIIRPISVNISDITFIGGGASGSYFGVKLSLAKNSIIENCTFKNFGYATIELNQLYNVRINNCRIGDNYTAGTGYGVMITNATAYTVVQNSYFYNARHCIAHGGIGTYGQQRRSLIDNNIFAQSDASQTVRVLDAHPETVDWTISNNTIFAGVNEYTITCTANNNFIKGNTFYGGYGIQTYDGDLTSAYQNIYIKDNVFNNVSWGFRNKDAVNDKVNIFQFDNNTMVGNRMQQLVQIARVNNISISGNKYYSTKVGNTGSAVIDVNTCNNGNVINNIITRGSRGSILLTSATHMNVSGNILNDYACDGTGAGIVLTNSNYNRVVNNTLAAAIHAGQTLTEFFIGGIVETGTSNYNYYFLNDVNQVVPHASYTDGKLDVNGANSAQDHNIQ